MGILEKKICLVTGGAVGIGRATAFAMAREGAKVVVADISDSEVQQTAETIRSQGGESFAYHCDVSDPEQVKGMIAQTVNQFGRVDCAFNNAGTEGEVAATADCTECNWDRVIAVNLKGVWLCMKQEIAAMLPKGGGVIINTASVAGMVAERGFPAYAAAKGGVIQLSRTTAVEYAAAGIRVNCICPGVVETPMIHRAFGKMTVDAMMPGAIPSQFGRAVANRVIGTKLAQKMITRLMQPLGRAGKPEEIAETVVFLCSDGATYITGQALPVDGGMTAA